jgi:hypothetical protein
VTDPGKAKIKQGNIIHPQAIKERTRDIKTDQKVIFKNAFPKGIKVVTGQVKPVSIHWVKPSGHDPVFQAHCLHKAIVHLVVKGHILTSQPLPDGLAAFPAEPLAVGFFDQGKKLGDFASLPGS